MIGEAEFKPPVWISFSGGVAANSNLRPLFFYFLVYGFLGRKNGSVGRGKKKKKNPQNI